jgi:hypothetical protein
MAYGKKTGGRTKGTPNKLSSTVKANVVAVFDDLNGEDLRHMKEWARENPTQYYNLYAKLLPTEIEAEVEHGGSIAIGSIDPESLTDEQLRAIASIKVNPD